MHNEFWNNDSLNFLNKHPELSDIGEILLKLHSDYSKLLSAKSRNSYYRKALNFFNQEIGKVYLFTDDNNAMRIKVNFKKRLFNYSNFEIYVIAKYSCGYIFLRSEVIKAEMMRKISDLKESNCEPFIRLAELLIQW